MKTTLAWLKTHLDTERALDEIVATLVMRGLEVDGIENRAKDLAPLHRRARRLGRAASQCRQAARLRRRHRQGRAFRWCAARPTRGPA